MRIDFYLTQTPTAEAIACRLIEKAYQANQKVYVYTQSQAQAEKLDAHLWTFKDNSFIPHNLIGEGPNAPPPIQLGATSPPNRQFDILINLSEQLPAFYQQFNRVIEIITNDETIKMHGRERYRTYSQHGHAIQTHQI